MPSPKLEYRVLLSSPSDLSDERQSAAEIVEEVSASLAETYPVVLRLLSWEHAASFGLETREGGSPKTNDNWDVYLGMMHLRFASPNAGFANGTEEEFMRAYRLWNESQGKRALMLYFDKSAVDLDEVDLDQLAKVKAFKNQISSIDGLCRDFTSVENFKDLLRAHLTSVIIHLYNQQRSEFDAQGEPGHASIFAPAAVEEDYLLDVLNHAESAMAGVGKLKSAIDAIASELNDSKTKIESHEQAMQVAGVNQDIQGMRRSITALLKVMVTLGKSLSDRRRDYKATAGSYFESLSTTISLMKASLGGEMDVTSLKTKHEELVEAAESFARARQETEKTIEKAPNLAKGVHLARVQLKREFKGVAAEVDASLSLMKNLLDIAQS